MNREHSDESRHQSALGQFRLEPVRTDIAIRTALSVMGPLIALFLFIYLIHQNA